MTDHERLSDMPAPLRWFLILFKQVGFPVIVCMFMGYMYFVEQEKTRRLMEETRQVTLFLKDSIDQLNKTLKRVRANN